MRPECCTQHLLELMGFTSDLLARHGIVHWLDYGALLGAVREGELIRWDNDVDFSMLQRQEQAVLALSEEIAAADYCLDTSQQGVIRILYSEVNELHVDLFLWEVRDGLLLPLEDTSYAWPGMASWTVSHPRRSVISVGSGRHTVWSLAQMRRATWSCSNRSILRSTASPSFCAFIPSAPPPPR